MFSLRRRLLLGTSLGMLAVLLLAGGAIYTLIQSSLLAEFDRGLLKKAKTLTGFVEQEWRKIEIEFGDADLAEFRREERPEYFQLWLADGSVLARASSLENNSLLYPAEFPQKPLVQAVVLPDGRPGRVAYFPFFPRLDIGKKAKLANATIVPKRMLFALTHDVLDLEDTLASFRLILWVVGILATLSSLGILFWLIHIGLKPAYRLAREIAQIDEEKLSLRLDHTQSPTELQPIVLRLNELLSRLDQAFAREKTMTANISHELRTPLAGLRSILEVSLSRERQAPAYREALLDCFAICEQAQTLVEGLLTLARLDANCAAPKQEKADIKKVLQSSWKPFETMAQEKNLSIHWKVDTNEIVKITDPDYLHLVFRNLFENAVHYVERQGSIIISAKRVDKAILIEIRNSGSQLSEKDISQVFTRFWRGDSAREKNTLHCGLGLSICHTVVERLGGSITARLEHGFFLIQILL